MRRVPDHISLGVSGSTKALEHAVGRTSDHTAAPVSNIEREWRAAVGEDENYICEIAR